MDNKIVKVIFKEGWETMYNTDLTQVDFGQILQVEGVTLPDGNVEVHFSLTEHNGEAPISIGTVKDNVITVDIPDFILAKENTYNSSYEAYAWIYVTDGESGRTIRKIVFTIDTRAEPTTNVPEDQKDKFLQEVRQVLAETKEVAQSVRNDADNGKFSGIPGEKGEDGKSAYDYAVEGGFEGTEQEFTDLMGKPGEVDLTGYVSKEQHEAELLKAMVKVTTDKSPFHHITDSANMKVLDFGMEGITEQRTTSGKNIWNPQSTDYVDGIYRGWKVKNDTTKNMTITIIDKNNGADISGIYFGLTTNGKNSSGAPRWLIDNGTILKTKITLATHEYVTAYSTYLPTVAKKILYRFDVMVELGDTFTSYEPFTNGASPNPDFEQPITLAGVLNEETGRYEHKCCVGNKNLLDCTDYVKYQSGTDEYYNSPSDYTFGNNILTLLKPTGTFNQMYVIYKVYLVENINYSISCEKVNVVLKEDTSTNVEIPPTYEVRKDGVLLVRQTTNNLSFTANENGFYSIQITFNSNSKSLVKAEIHGLQLVCGNVDTDFVPHASQPFTLTSDRPLTMWDKLVKRDGVWGWSVYSYKLIIDGSYYWVVYSDDKGFSIQKNVLLNTSNMRDGYCNQLRVGNSALDNSIALGYGNKFLYVGKVSFYDETLSDSGLANFKAYLNEHPLEIITYADEEQAFIPLPDEEQTLLNNLETYYGVTNVYNEQGCPMWIKYCADQELHWNQKLLQIQQAII